MASKASPPIAFFLFLNLLFFTLVSSQKSPPPPPPSPPPPANCPLVNLGICANLLGVISLNITLPTNSSSPCCNVINGLGSTGLQAGVCLCNSLKISLLGVTSIGLNLTTTAMLNSCGILVPSGFTCP
ncbi:hypothetical protein CRYUN_Cryun19dG0141400 [Craigia yunnanensis]